MITASPLHTTVHFPAHTEALKHYSSALALRPAGDAALYSNRSAALLALGLHEEALADATRCVELRPAWWKAHYRCALLNRP